MDTPRLDAAKDRRRRNVRLAAIVLVCCAAGALALRLIKPASPTIDRSTVVTDVVRRGPMDREVHGAGVLVPVEALLVTAEATGRVRDRLLEPGAAVRSDTVILRLVAPEVDQAWQDANSKWLIAEAELATLNAQLETQRMTLRAELATIEFEATRARLQAEASERLARDGLTSTIELELVRARMSEIVARSGIRHEMEKTLMRAAQAQVSAKEAQVAQCRDFARLRKSQVESLTVRAGIGGILQSVAVEPGQQVVTGQPLARVIEPSLLMARLRIAAQEARDVELGMKVRIDTGGAVVGGAVSRLDPTVTDGTVVVDVSLGRELVRDGRPDLPVYGTIALEHLQNVLQVGRPAMSQPSQRLRLFRFEPGGKELTRVEVQLGRSSARSVEIQSGLSAGDEVVISEMSRWEEFGRVSVK